MPKRCCLPVKMKKCCRELFDNASEVGIYAISRFEVAWLEKHNRITLLCQEPSGLKKHWTDLPLTVNFLFTKICSRSWRGESYTSQFYGSWSLAGLGTNGIWNAQLHFLSLFN